MVRVWIMFTVMWLIASSDSEQPSKFTHIKKNLWWISVNTFSRKKTSHIS
jgi:hypothetical protein